MVVALAGVSVGPPPAETVVVVVVVLAGVSVGPLLAETAAVVVGVVVVAAVPVGAPVGRLPASCCLVRLSLGRSPTLPAAGASHARRWWHSQRTRQWRPHQTSWRLQSFCCSVEFLAFALGDLLGTQDCLRGICLLKGRPDVADAASVRFFLFVFSFSILIIFLFL